MSELSSDDRKFLDTVHKYLSDNNIKGLLDDPEDGYQLCIRYRKVRRLSNRIV